VEDYIESIFPVATDVIMPMMLEAIPLMMGGSPAPAEGGEAAS
jgi:hypothetical protein